MWNVKESLKIWSAISTVLTQTDNPDTPSHILIPRGLIRQKSSRNNKSWSTLIILLFQFGQDNMHSLLWKVKVHHSRTVMGWRFIFRFKGLFNCLTMGNINYDAILILYLFLNGLIHIHETNFVLFMYTLIIFLEFAYIFDAIANIKLNSISSMITCWLSVICIVTLH